MGDGMSRHQDACGHGHPLEAIYHSGEGTNFCQWCADISAARKAALEEAAQLMDDAEIAHKFGDGSMTVSSMHWKQAADAIRALAERKE